MTNLQEKKMYYEKLIDKHVLEDSGLHESFIHYCYEKLIQLTNEINILHKKECLNEHADRNYKNAIRHI